MLFSRTLQGSLQASIGLSDLVTPAGHGHANWSAHLHEELLRLRASVWNWHSSQTLLQELHKESRPIVGDQSSMVYLLRHHPGPAGELCGQFRTQVLPFAVPGLFIGQSDPSDVVDPCRRVSIPGTSHLQSLAVVHRSKDGVEILRLPQQWVILQLPQLSICVAHSAQPEVKEHRFHQTSSSRCP